MCVTFLVVWFTQCDADSINSMPKLNSPNASSTSAPKSSDRNGAHHKESKRLLRKHDTRESEDDDETASKTDEERVITASDIVDFLGIAVKKLMDKAKLQIWLYLNFDPDQVYIMLNVVSTDDERYKQYIKYFYDYFVTNVDKPLSHFPPKIVNQIWKARLHTWLETLTPPQVYAKLKLGTGQHEPARIYYDEFASMWSKKQGRASEKAVLTIKNPHAK